MTDEKPIIKKTEYHNIWYIIIGNKYLWKDGTQNNCTGWLPTMEHLPDAPGYWKTKKEAEKFLKTKKLEIQTIRQNKQFGHPDFYKLLDKMADLHSRKNHDYAGDKDPLKNLRASERIGLTPFQGVLVRLQDKWSRLEQFVQSGELLVKDEKVEDTLIDNAIYSLLAIILLKEEKRNGG